MKRTLSVVAVLTIAVTAILHSIEPEWSVAFLTWVYSNGILIASTYFALRASRVPTFKTDDPNRKAEFLRHADDLGDRPRPVQVVTSDKTRTDAARRVKEGE